MTTDQASSASSALAASGPTLIVSNMDVTYRVRGQDRLALRDVSFSIGRGESYGLVGESGSGKSTAALALVRYLPSNGRVSAGTISINGLDPLSMGKRDAAPAAGQDRLDGVPGARAGAEPVPAGGPADRRGLRGRRASRPGRPWRRPRTCCARSRSPIPAGSCGGIRTSCPAGWRSGR